MAGWTSNSNGVASEIEEMANKISAFIYYNFGHISLGCSYYEKIAKDILEKNKNG